MFSQHRRPNRLEIDSGSVTGRVAALRRRVGSQVKIFAALKADGYGFGTLPMARAALAGGAEALSLIDRAEAIALRRPASMRRSCCTLARQSMRTRLPQRRRSVSF